MKISLSWGLLGRRDKIKNKTWLRKLRSLISTIHQPTKLSQTLCLKQYLTTPFSYQTLTRLLLNLPRFLHPLSQATASCQYFSIYFRSAYTKSTIRLPVQYYRAPSMTTNPTLSFSFLPISFLFKYFIGLLEGV